MSLFGTIFSWVRAVFEHPPECGCLHCCCKRIEEIGRFFNSLIWAPATRDFENCCTCRGGCYHTFKHTYCDFHEKEAPQK